MRNMMRFWIVALLLCSASIPSVSAAGQQNPLIRVGIQTSQANINLSAKGDFSLIDIKSGKELGKFRGNEKVTLAFKAPQIAINGTKTVSQEIAAVPTDSKSLIQVNGRQYRGAITIHPTQGRSGLTVVNTLPVDEYVYGILPKEISPAWPTDAVKAQAVAARSYALHSLNKHQSDGYDVCPTTDCQVYGGYDSENPTSNRTVDETKGLVLTYNHKVIPAFFHSNGGGYTENSENVWGTAYPFLRGVQDYDDKSPHYRWEKEYSANEVVVMLQGAGYRIGELQAIELSPLTQAPVENASDRGISGRVKNVKFIGTQGIAQVNGNKLRTLLGLNSTLFDITVKDAGPRLIDFEITASKKKKETAVKLAPKPSGDRSDIRKVNGADTSVTIRGFGWGHGLGMSQWGAKAMADKAPAGSTEYFKDILKHYYTGVTIEKMY